MQCTASRLIASKSIASVEGLNRPVVDAHDREDMEPSFRGPVSGRRIESGLVASKHTD